MIAACLEDEEPYLRADAARVVRAWEGLEGVDSAALAPLLATVTTLAKDDQLTLAEMDSFRLSFPFPNRELASPLELLSLRL